jgi:hypothetical protein
MISFALTVHKNSFLRLNNIMYNDSYLSKQEELWKFKTRFDLEFKTVEFNVMKNIVIK